MLEDRLDSLVVATEQNHVLIERFDPANKLDAVHKKNGNGGVFFAQGVQEHILKVLTFVHSYCVLG